MELPFTTFAEAVSAFVQLVGQLDPDAWDGPGLGAWDLRALVGHTSRALRTVETYLDRLADEARLASAAAYYRAVSEQQIDPAAVVERGQAAGAALGQDPAQFVATVAARVVQRVRLLDDEGADPVVESIAGAIALSDYLSTRTFELVVHSFDIATAGGLEPPSFGSAVLTEAIGLAAEVAVLRGDGRRLLLALTGRSALPPDFSIV